MHSVAVSACGTALQVTEWSRCDKAVRPIWTDAGRRAVAEVEARYARAGPPTLSEAKSWQFAPDELWPVGVVFPTSQAAAAARFAAEYLHAELSGGAEARVDAQSKVQTDARAPAQVEAAAEAGGGCFSAHSTRWSHGRGGSIAMRWVSRRGGASAHPDDPQTVGTAAHTGIDVAEGAASLTVGAFEEHVRRLRGNLSHASASNWDHYMDYKLGLLFDDCGPL